ncbi:MAG: abortive phage infection protein, partial [Prochlorotrichaceae cyanobacterium]
VAFRKYLQAKFNNRINVNNYIVEIYEKGEKEIIIKTFKFLSQFVDKSLEVIDSEEKTAKSIVKFLTKLSHYEKIKDNLEDLEISVEDIEGILEDNDIFIDIAEK